MKKLLTFLKGGVHPNDRKISKSERIEKIDLANEFIFPFSQHIGCPSECLVKVGDSVKRGDLIGKAGGGCSANIHSSVTGKVKSVSPTELVITREDSQEEYTQLDLDKKSLNDVIFDAGIVGLGGATFPSHIKLNPANKEDIDAIVINGAECEPYLTSDHRLMLEKGNEIIEGIKLIQSIFPKKPKAYIGIEANKMDAINTLNELLKVKEETNIKVYVLKTMYPQGGEKQLIQAILGREVPSGGFPFNINVVVQNVATAYSIYEAYKESKPLIERVVTISGDVISEPKNLMLPMGTPLSHIVEKLNIDMNKVNKIIMGGPMMGKTTVDLNTPITKGVSGVLFVSKDCVNEKPERDCIGCGFCVEKCPVGLIPSRLAMLSKANKVDESIEYGVNDCIECGCCAYSCPAGIKLVNWIQLMKDEVRKELRKRSCQK